MNKEDQIIESWHANANAWIEVIETNGIESRKLATNKAILDAIILSQPARVLDIGCGEGWLVNQLHQRKIEVAGIDIVPAFIEKTRAKVPGEFYVGSYSDVVTKKISFAKSFDAVVINFALIGKESSEELLRALPSYLNHKGKLFVQTLHPWTRKELGDYTTGWKSGSWNGLNGQFILPYDWYFRTLEDWLALLSSSGFANVTLQETRHPQSGSLLSVIFIASVR